VYCFSGCLAGSLDVGPATSGLVGVKRRDVRQTANNQPTRVLVVDDEALLRWSLAQILEDEGFEVEQAGSGAEALHTVAASSATFDVVLLDFRLPDSNDLNLLSKLRQMTPRSAVILMTAFSTPETAQGARDLGAVQVVSKPFDMSEMVRLVEQVC
jgi:DNA-binding NtrC family response regulator